MRETIKFRRKYVPASKWIKYQPSWANDIHWIIEIVSYPISSVIYLTVENPYSQAFKTISQHIFQQYKNHFSLIYITKVVGRKTVETISLDPITLSFTKCPEVKNYSKKYLIKSDNIKYV